ncbi:hypothetical protein L0337_38800 [candidate division KSB1 bacterium]|nr:hypothetical protein [candidate division KSB1 bacterium]
MITVSGTVQGGLVKLPDAMRVSDGSRVIITILEPMAQRIDRFLPDHIESEDVEFVRACRGRLAKQLQEAEQ